MRFWLPVAAQKHPERPALDSPERTLSYAELAEAARRGGVALQAQGVRRSDRVALEIDDRIEFLIALHACLLVGAPAVPVDGRLGEAEREVRRRETVAVLREPLGSG